MISSSDAHYLMDISEREQMLDLADQSGGLIYAGTLANPLAGHLA